MEQYLQEKRIRNKKIMIVMLIATILNLALFGAKFYVGLAASSISTISDSFNSLADSVVTFVGIICFFLILHGKKNDKLSHGFGRLEYVVALLMAVAMVIVGALFLFRSLDRLALTSPINFKWLYFGITASTIVFKICMAIFYKIANRKLNSDVLKCAFYDSLLDIGVSTMSLIGLVSMEYISLRLDAIFGIIVSIIMLIGGIIICKNGFIKLLGENINPKTKEEIINLVMESNVVEKCNIISFDDYGATEKYLTIEILLKNEYDLSSDLLNIDLIKNEILYKYDIFLISKIEKGEKDG